MKKTMIFPVHLSKVLFFGILFFLTLSTFKGLASNASDTLLAEQYSEFAKTKVNLSQLDSAIFYYKKSADIYEKFELHEKHADCLNNISEQYFYMGQLSDADMYAHKALKLGCNHGLSHQIGKSYNNMAAVFLQKGMSDSAAVYLEKALIVWLPLDGEQHLRIAAIYTNLGYMYQADGDYQKSHNYTVKAIEILNTLNENVDEYLAFNYNNLGSYYNARGLYAEAVFNFEKALQTGILKYGEKHLAITSIYINLGEIYRQRRDYEKALLYTNEALAIFRKLSIEVHQNIAAGYTNAGTTYHEMGDYDNAIKSYAKAQEVWSAIGNQHYTVATLNNNISQVYLQKNNPDSAKIFLEKAINIFKINSLKNHPELSTFYLNLGRCFLVKKEYPKANEYFTMAAELLQHLMGEKHPNLAACYKVQGEIFMEQQKYPEALEYFQKALVANVQDFNNADIYVNPKLENILSKAYLLYVLERKAEAFYNLFLENADSVLILQSALHTGELAIQLLDTIRFDYKSEDSKFFLNKEFANVFTNTLNYAIALYQKTKDEQYYQKAFQIAEKSKSAALFATLTELEARTIGNIPDSLQKTARMLKHDIGFYDQKIKEESKKDLQDVEKLDKWQDIYFKSVKEYDKLISFFEKKYPEYYDLKYRLSVANVDDVQSSLASNETLVEYMLTDTLLVAFVISKHSAEYFSTPIDSNFIKQLDEFRERIISKDFTEESVSKYCEVANKLYQQLIAPVEKLSMGKSLIIIPDGKLATIPFEALLTSPVQVLNQSSKDYPYLIKQQPISYGYSSTIMLNSIKKRNHADHPSILSFAPSFQSNNELLLSELSERGAEFVSLPGVKEEVTKINEVAGGTIFIDSNASEANFKQFAPGYKILHIATHGIIDDVNPMMSRLIFSNETDTIEDGALTVYELYSLKLNADMAVLSSCNSGYGKLQQGEGVMSMARAFLYAGVPAIVMSQWSVNDQSSALVMANFYKELKSGLSKDQALQKAKLDYLQSADKLTANPYFWAGFVVIGNQSPVDFSTGLHYWWLLLIPFLMVGWLVVRRKKAVKN